jgi:hypothetical protein
MSFSFRLPEEDPICECKYDEVHDRMDREDCAFHCDMVEDAKPANAFPAPRKPPLSNCYRASHPEVRIGRFELIVDARERQRRFSKQQD